MVDQPLTLLRLFHDAFLVVLAQTPAQLVVVHRRPVLPLAPERGHAVAVHNLEHTLLPVYPVDRAGVQVGLVEEFFDELPQVDVVDGAAGDGGDGVARRPISGIDA